eukprot:COSAG06_NODE_6700_length_2820_cov_17.488056_2_plen_385_part_00
MDLGPPSMFPFTGGAKAKPKRSRTRKEVVSSRPRPLALPTVTEPSPEEDMGAQATLPAVTEATLPAVTGPSPEEDMGSDEESNEVEDVMGVDYPTSTTLDSNNLSSVIANIRKTLGPVVQQQAAAPEEEMGAEELKVRETPQDTENRLADQADADAQQGLQSIEQDEPPEDAAANVVDAAVDRLAAELEKKVEVTTAAERKQEQKQREKEDKQRETPQNIDEDKEEDAKLRNLRKEAEKVRKKTSAAVDKLADLMGKMDIEDPAEQQRVAEFWDGYGVEDMQISEDYFYDDDGTWNQGKYDAARDIVKETYAQQMKRLKAASRLLKRLRKDKTRMELPVLPGWQFLPGDRRIWTDPQAVPAEIAYPKDGYVSEGLPQSVFGFGN